MFWQCLKPYEGKILVDGTDIGVVDLKD